MADMIGIGTGALRAYQRALQVVSHNVSNANTEGYSRQRLELTSQTPHLAGSSYIGNGVKIDTISRVYDQFLVDQVRTYSASASHAEIFAKNAGLVDDMLADPDIGLAPAMDDFFAEMQTVSNDPSSLPARQSLFSQAESLVDRFEYLNQRFEDLRNQTARQMNFSVSEINGLASQIADVNKTISLTPRDAQPNDLLDKRDLLLNKLAGKVAITTVQQDNGAVNVFFGKGQMLVFNQDAHALTLSSNQYDIKRMEVSVTPAGAAPVQVSGQVTGGELGALLDFRNQVLDGSQNSLGILAIGFADTLNDQQRLGQDLNGGLGKDFFNVAALETRTNVLNAGTAVVGATLTDETQLTNDEYELSYSLATGYSLTRLSDGNVNTFAALPATTNHGFSLNIASGAIADGDRFLVRPGRRGANDLSINITSPTEIAAAAPVRTGADIINNTGNGTITPAVVTDTSSLVPYPGWGGINMTYNAGVITYAGAAAGSFAYTDGQAVTINGMSFTINGSLANGDTFNIEENVGGVGDNRNALLMSDLQNQKFMDGASASYNDFYGAIVADVGIVTRQSQLTEVSQQKLLEQAVDARDSLSGVNLDEEAANLVKFQQAYQAASQVVVAANSMFQSLLSAIRG